MNTDRTKNTIRNTYWGIVNKAIGMLLPFMVRTILIKKLGTEYLGLNSLFAAILNVLSLAELGISNAIICSLYKPIAEKDLKAIRALLGLYRRAYRIIGLIILGVGLMVIPFLRYLIKGSVPNFINIYILFLIYLFNCVVSYLLFAYKSCLFIAHQKSETGLKIQTLCTTLLNLAQIVVLLLIKNYYVYVILIPVFTIINNLIIEYVTKKEYPKYYCEGKVGKGTLSELKKQIGGLMIGKISSTIRASIDSLYISIFCGLVTVGMYNNYFCLVTMLSGIIQLLENSMVAGVGNSIVTETIDKNYRDFNKFTFMLQWIVGISSIVLLCSMQPFINAWLGKKYMFKDEMAILCAIYFLLFNISIIRSIYTQAIGLWWQMRYISICDIFINLLLNLVFVYFMDAYGIIFASVLDVAFVSIPFTTYILFKYYFGKEVFLKFFFDLLKYIGLIIITGSIMYIICFCIRIDNSIVKLMVNGMISFTLSNIFFWVIFRKHELFEESTSFIKTKILRK